MFPLNISLGTLSKENKWEAGKSVIGGATLAHIDLEAIDMFGGK